MAGNMESEITTDSSFLIKASDSNHAESNAVVNEGSSAAEEFKFSNEPSFEKLRQLQKQFADDRDWNQYHSPRNLLLAMVGEVGELAELFQWRGEVKEGLPDWTEEEKVHLQQELSDVLLYLLRLSEKCHVDLPQAALNKVALNAKKYPAPKVRGSSRKYTEYLQ